MQFFRILIFIFCALIVSANQLDAQVNPNQVPYDFKKAKVITDSLINYGFGRDAFDHLEKVFDHAIEEKNVSVVYDILNLYPDVVGISMMEVDEKHTILSKFELLYQFPFRNNLPSKVQLALLIKSFSTVINASLFVSSPQITNVELLALFTDPAT
jgi:hypothetical protein